MSHRAFLIYEKETGRVLRTGVVPASMVSLQVTGPEEEYLILPESIFCDGTEYVDLETLEIVKK